MATLTKVALVFRQHDQGAGVRTMQLIFNQSVEL
jgi:hypothetical protein